MRVSHRRSLFGYSLKEVEKQVAEMRTQYEKLKMELEEELMELKQSNQSMFEEIAFRQQELDEQAELEKELEGLLHQTLREQSKQIFPREQPVLEKEIKKAN
ncbi:hypothetical protein [Paenibacillus aceris]|uniref:Uncharacterized protein YigA (DUF484 family) n=1 Tax=Paenibacillus aceris TaxID=869555 RepID=A0ABS4HT46_9BACL|nr:hypothetical protein [Paenibacillus aceris]MBP1961792.1 uncharacterized protein YigA (DUF484 family) [Paenibacillus aceris]NHW34351.1 hypothetical protein [Paenibacillus aceris]